MPFIYKKISKNWNVFLLITLFIYLLWRVYVVSGGSISITLDAFTFISAILGLILYSQFDSLSRFLKDNEILELKLKASNQTLEQKLKASNQTLEQRLEERNDKLEQKLDENNSRMMKTIDSKIGREISYLDFKIKLIQARYSFDEAQKWKDAGVYENVITSCADVFQQSDPESYLVTSALDMIQETLGIMLSEGSHINADTVAKLKEGLDQVPGKGALSVKKILIQVEKL